MTKKDVLIIFVLFVGFFSFYITQNPHYGVLSGDEMAMHHLDMVYEGSPEVPSGLRVAENPTYPVGSKALSRADHMAGMMDGVEVTIVGAYETVAYATTYTSSNSGMRVEEHKWVVHEELLDVAADPLEGGTEVLTRAQHMKGMSDAVHSIDYSIPTTVYMVDFELPNGMKVSNHKWVIEEELEPLN